LLYGELKHSQVVTVDLLQKQTLPTLLVASYSIKLVADRYLKSASLPTVLNLLIHIP